MAAVRFCVIEERGARGSILGAAESDTIALL
jgi:hypothetical protein